MIEEELDDTDLVEFEAELDALDEEINQLWLVFFLLIKG